MIVSPPARLTVVWLVLVLATVLGLALGQQPSASEAVHAGVLAVAFVKMRLVAMEFMELRIAPPHWRLLFDAWAVALWGALVALFMWGGH